ncbi:amphi-Trp domain-containing protein, partial [Halobium palmae]
GATGTGRSAGSPSKVTFLVGNESATVRPPENVTFEVDVSTDSSLLESGARERVEFAIEWDADDVPSDDELSIE